jgi:hypothetical protein
VEEMREKDVEMALGEGELGRREEGSAALPFMGMLGVGAGMVTDEERLEMVSAVRVEGMRFGSEFELAFNFALKLENRSMDGTLVGGWRTTEIVSAAFFRSPSEPEIEGFSGSEVGLGGGGERIWEFGSSFAWD